MEDPEHPAQEVAAAGVAVVEGVFAPHEIEALRRSLATLAGRGRAGARHVMGEPDVASLARDPRLVGLASGVLCTLAVPFRATFFDKSRDANWLVVWHQDTALPLRARHDRPGWGPWSTKAGILYAHAPAAALERIVALRVPLDDSTAANGPLRVLRGSHRLGVLTDEAVAEARHRFPVIECVVRAGGVLVMRPLIVHSSSKSETDAPRRVLHFEYAPSLDLGEGVVLAVA